MLIQEKISQKFLISNSNRMEWIESNLVCILILVITKLDNHEAFWKFPCLMLNECQMEISAFGKNDTITVSYNGECNGEFKVTFTGTLR